MDTINKLDAALYVDVACHVCGRIMALSNAYQEGNAYFCAKHYVNKKGNMSVFNYRAGITLIFVRNIME